jgi:2-methylcitrate dehydratase
MDGTATEKIVIEYPIGHRRRRAAAIPLLQQKAAAAVTAHYGDAKSAQLTSLFTDRAKLESLSAPSFAGDFVR